MGLGWDGMLMMMATTLMAKLSGALCPIQGLPLHARSPSQLQYTSHHDQNTDDEDDGGDHDHDDNVVQLKVLSRFNNKKKGSIKKRFNKKNRSIKKRRNKKKWFNKKKAQ